MIIKIKMKNNKHKNNISQNPEHKEGRKVRDGEGEGLIDHFGGMLHGFEENLMILLSRYTG